MAGLATRGRDREFAPADEVRERCCYSRKAEDNDQALGALSRRNRGRGIVADCDDQFRCARCRSSAS